MDLAHLLKLLLIAELALLGLALIAAVTLWRRSAIARRVTRNLEAESFAQAGGPQPQLARLVQLAFRDVTPAEAAAIPWFARQFHLSEQRAQAIFALGRVALAVLGAASAVSFAGVMFPRSSALGAIQFLAAIAGAFANWWLARRLLRGWSTSRREQVSSAMPYALDLILICLDSGAALETAMARVAKELAARDPLVAEELNRTLMDVNVIGNREQAFRNLAERIGTPNMIAITTVLSQSLQYGSSLSDALKGAIQNMKRTELLALEERAGKLPVQLSLPGMALTFPQVIILLAGPGVLDLLDTFTSMQR